jgi:formylglycine-generating enzyme
MKPRIYLLTIIGLLTGLHQAAGQNAHFFRIVGPAAATITAFNPDGTLVWSNALTGTNYTVQTVSSLPSGTNWVNYVQLPVTNSVNTNQIVAFNPPTGMAFIPAGSFTIGDRLDGEYPTNVYVSAFYMDVNLVSYNQWAGIYAYATNNGYGFDYVGSGKAANQPVQTVDWYDCVKWCNARSQQAGLTQVYYIDTGFTQVFTNGDGDYGTTVYANWTANGYRLPTEAEWEKAARGGLSGQRFPWGDIISETNANYVGNTGSYAYDLGPHGYNVIGQVGGVPYTSPVGSFPANGYGLNDMAGNVLEMCWDWYYAGSPYPAGSPYLGGIDPRGPVGPLGGRVARGGSWDNDASHARCADRDICDPPSADYGIGVRCVRRR